MNSTSFPIYKEPYEAELSQKTRELSKELEEKNVPHLFFVLTNSEMTNKNFLALTHIAPNDTDGKVVKDILCRFVTGIESVLNSLLGSITKSFVIKIKVEKI